MSDPVQVVAEAQHRRCPPDLRWRHPVTDHTASSRAIVAALEAEGALMPEAAENHRLAVAHWRTVAEYADRMRTEAEADLPELGATLAAQAALLQEVREVLGRHEKTDPPYGGWGPHHCKRCDEVWPCPEAVLLSKLDSTLASSTSAPAPLAGTGVENGAVGSTDAVDPAFDGTHERGLGLDEPRPDRPHRKEP